jgi:sulfate transport system substrate-binding protein
MRNNSVLVPARAGRFLKGISGALFLLVGVALASAGPATLLNVSFDVSRQLFEQINPAFIQRWKAQSGETITVNQSHAGSSKQARAVIDGLDADVVTLNQATDIDAIADNSRLLPKDWRKLLPHNSAPYTSTIVFLVRKGNPKGIKDWDDLVKSGVSVIIPNPKTSGNGRYTYLGAYAFALKKFSSDDAKAREFVGALFQNVPILDTGGRGATTTFVQRQIGDALLTFEAEVLQTVEELGADKFDVIVPPQSIEAEMPVAVVQKVASRRDSEAAARAYLEFLYTEEAQDIIARNYYRPRSGTVARRYAKQFATLTLVSVDDVFGGWANAQKVHFADGGVFDQIYATKKR